jgi:hypothetical protein
MMAGKWLLDIGARLTCMSYQQFRIFPIKKRPKKLNLNQWEAKGASGTDLIQEGIIYSWWNGMEKRLCRQ